MKVSKRIMALTIALLMVLTTLTSLATVSFASGSTLYVSTTGNDTTGDGSQAKPYASTCMAIDVAAPGTTIIVAEGIYTNYLTNRNCNGGTKLQPIIVKVEDGKTAIISSYTDQNFQQKGYITFDGFTFDLPQPGTNYLWLTEAVGLTFKNCTFNQAASGYNAVGILNSSDISVLNCSINGGVNVGQGGTGSPILLEGVDGVTFSNNKISPSGFHGIAIGGTHDNWGVHAFSKNIVISGNEFRMTDPAQTDGSGCGIYGLGANSNILIENNLIYQPGTAYSIGVGIKLTAQNAIIRNNSIIGGTVISGAINFVADNAVMTIGSTPAPSSTPGPIGTGSGNIIDNRVYNNTIVGNSTQAIKFSISTGFTGVIKDNKFVNNILYNNDTSPLTISGTTNPAGITKNPSYIQFASKNLPFPNNNLFYNNVIAGLTPNERLIQYKVSTVEQLLTLTEAQTSFASAFYGNVGQNPNLTADWKLTAGSTAIDAGAFLAKTTGAGTNTTTVVVDDSKFFTDGFGRVAGDIIKIGATTAQITAINYATNTITLATPVSFSANANVGFAYNGNAPDIGAFESVYNGQGATATPIPTPTPVPTPTPTLPPTPTPTLPPTPTPVPTPTPAIENIGNSIDLVGKVSSTDYLSTTTMTNGVLTDDTFVTITNAKIFINFVGGANLKAISLIGGQAATRAVFYKVYTTTNGTTWNEAGIDFPASYTIADGSGNYHPDYVNLGMTTSNMVVEDIPTFKTTLGLLAVQPIIFKDIQVGVTQVKIVMYGNSSTSWYAENNIAEINAYGTYAAPTPSPTIAPTPSPTPTPLLGDVTGDGRITPADALKLLQYVSGKTTLTPTQMIAADVTKNGIVQPSDALKILQYCIGKIPGF